MGTFRYWIRKINKMNKYPWLKVGARVKLKTFEELKRTYPQGMPLGLTPHMEDFLGTIQIIRGIRYNIFDSSVFQVYLEQPEGYVWPEGALKPLYSKLGNEY